MMHGFGASHRLAFQKDFCQGVTEPPDILSLRNFGKDAWLGTGAKRILASFVYAATSPARPSREIQAVIDDRAIPTGWNLLRGARAGHSVVNLSLKAAYWMGIREVYVLGVDHDFVLPASGPVDVVGGNEVYVSAGEQNHFHAEYRKPGEAWTYPKLETIAEEFGNARSVFEAAGGCIKNASRSTKLDVWERVNLDDVLGETGPASLS